MPPKKKASGKKKSSKPAEPQRDVEIYMLQRKVEALHHRIGKLILQTYLIFSALKEMSMLESNANIETMQNTYNQCVQ